MSHEPKEVGYHIDGINPHVATVVVEHLGEQHIFVDSDNDLQEALRKARRKAMDHLPKPERVAITGEVLEITFSRPR